MSRYDGPLIHWPPQPDYLQAKQAELTELAADLCADDGRTQTKMLIQEASRVLGLPQHASIQQIRDLALSIEEDVALLHNDTLVAICFCFPSSWLPAKRLGMALARIHEPVADGKKLVNASTKIAQIMSDPQQGSFRRYVWTITTSPHLSQHPLRKNSIAPQKISDLYYRLETQTTVPISSPSGRASLFLVRVEVCPLALVWDNPRQRQQICASMNSMSSAVLAYKNLEHIKSFLQSSINQKE
jgi:hypothetical protein